LSPGYGKLAVLYGLLGYIIIRWPHGSRSGKTKIVENRLGGLEKSLLAVAAVATTLLPILWLTTSVLAFAEYPLHPFPFWLGLLLMTAGLWLFYRSHADLGVNWSVTLQVRENHRLVTAGVYKKIRHPMYSSMFLLAVAQMLVLPNWIAGPAYLAGFGLLYALRVGKEEKMMLERFGAEYEAYMRRSGRLIP
jgi:protein-S-isoprenylcysteine O-methyltransferase Ste14